MTSLIKVGLCASGLSCCNGRCASGTCQPPTPSKYKTFWITRVRQRHLPFSQIPAVLTPGFQGSTSAIMAQLPQALVNAARITTLAQPRSSVCPLRTLQPTWTGIKFYSPPPQTSPPIIRCLISCYSLCNNNRIKSKGCS